MRRTPPKKPPPLGPGALHAAHEACRQAAWERDVAAAGLLAFARELPELLADARRQDEDAQARRMVEGWAPAVREREMVRA